MEKMFRELNVTDEERAAVLKELNEFREKYPSYRDDQLMELMLIIRNRLLGTVVK